MIQTSGLLFYAVAMIAFGVEHFLFGNFPTGLLPVPAFLPVRLFWVNFAGVVFLMVGICIAIRKIRPVAAALLGGWWFLLFMVARLPLLFSDAYNPFYWTGALEVVALGGGALSAANLFSAAGVFTQSPARAVLARLGYYLFAGSLVVFGVQHLMYAAFIATLIPAWIPGKLFWAYGVGVAFLLTALSLTWKKKVQLSTTLLGIMFFLWVWGLHLPRALAAPRAEPEWTSTFVALAMSGIAFTLSGKNHKRDAAMKKEYRAT